MSAHRIAFALVMAAGCFVSSFKLGYAADTDAGSDCQDHVQSFRGLDDYHSVVQSLLLKGANAQAYVIWLPAFDAEMAVSIGRKGSSWYARSASVDSPIWRSKQLPDHRVVPDFNTSQKVRLAEQKLPPEMAKRILKAWHGVLERTRDEPKHMNSTDGVGYVFASDGLRGQDSNLMCGIGAVMLDVADALAKYVSTAESREREGLQEQMKQNILRIERKNYPKEPAKESGLWVIKFPPHGA